MDTNNDNVPKNTKESNETRTCNILKIIWFPMLILAVVIGGKGPDYIVAGIVVFFVGLLLGMIGLFVSNNILQSQIDIEIPTDNMQAAISELRDNFRDEKWIVVEDEGQLDFTKKAFNMENQPVVSVCYGISDNGNCIANVFTSYCTTKNLAIRKSGLLAKMRDTVINTLYKYSV